MKFIPNTLMIAYYKNKAANALKRYQKEVDSQPGGRAIASIVNPRVDGAKNEFNAAMDTLAEYDTACPKERL